MVIAGGTATLLGLDRRAVLVIVMSGGRKRLYRTLNLLGAIFVVIFMPESLVPGSVRLWRWAFSLLRPRAAPVLRRESRP